LVGVARTCIIEIGRELIAAKAAVLHGQWLPWLKVEFGWSDSTAQNYMAVARKFPTLGNMTSITIDATALYALSAPDVPQEARVEAVSRAEDGEHISKADAEAMIAKAIEVERAPGRYMEVGQAFKLSSVHDFSGITIDATALFGSRQCIAAARRCSSCRGCRDSLGVR
jgi:hypothetical protein